MTTAPRARLLGALDQFLDLWRRGHLAPEETDLFSMTRFTSSVHGNALGTDAIKQLLRADHGDAALALASTNHYASAGSAGLHVSAYLHGHRTASTSGPVRVSLFGAALVLTAAMDGDVLRVTDIDLTVDWVDGDLDPPDTWKSLRGSRFWKPGDQPPTLVSELHAPWSRSPDAESIGDAADRITDVFMRYVWSIDRADFGGMVPCLSPDMEGDFPPIGTLSGISDVIGQLKAFRQAWPWMQHFCIPLEVTTNSAGDEAQVAIGRIVPYRLHAPSGHRAYGAHYRLVLRRVGQGWQITRFAYIEGWIEWVDGAPRALR
jgi:SnoaL-like protein